MPSMVIDIKDIDDLKKIKLEDNYLLIGACTSLNTIIENSIISEKCNILKQAAEYVACHQIRNRATIGGNICNASPAADMSPPLYCLDAIFTYYQDGNYLDVKAKEFFKGPGQTVLKDDAILCYFKIPVSKLNAQSRYLRHSRRNALDLSAVGVAALKSDNEYAIALGSVAPTVIRVYDAEEILNKEGLTEDSIHKASEIAANTCKPISDLRASKEYRKEMVYVYTQRALKGLMEG